MSDKSTIEWTESTWNPVVGCLAVSPGCDRCYAAREASRRLRNVPAYAGLAENGVFTGEVRLLPERLNQPLRWTKPRTIFVNSMSDLFHADVPVEYIEQVWGVMRAAERHTFQVLTKRAERMERLTRGIIALQEPAPNVWLGVSVETDTYYSRIRHLQRTPAAVRFLSCEPLLAALPDLPLGGIDWVIVGGESGPGARPMHPEWVREIRDQCRRAGVAFFFKQWGEWVPALYVCGQGLLYGSEGPARPATHDWGTGEHSVRVGKRAAGRFLEGRTWDEMPRQALPA